MTIKPKLPETRKEKREIERAEIKHEGAIIKVLNEGQAVIDQFDKNGAQLTQMNLEEIQNRWMVYCAKCKRTMKGTTPDPNAFVIHLFENE